MTSIQAEEEIVKTMEDKRKKNNLYLENSLKIDLLPLD